MYATPGAAGLDVASAVDLILKPGERALVPTGWQIQVPSGYVADVRPRSGRAWREGVTVLNAPGTVDEDYRGELKVLLVNLGQAPVHIFRGERIAQLVLVPVGRAHVVEGELTPTARGEGGWGSTGR
jgi:dUTP pyrophosphatase